MLAEHAREISAGNETDARHHDLQRGEQRKLYQRDPRELILKLRAGLCGGDHARRIIVGGAGDETGTKHTECSHDAAAMLFFLYRSGTTHVHSGNVTRIAKDARTPPTATARGNDSLISELDIGVGPPARFLRTYERAT